MPYVALDFETANCSKTSPYALGMVRFDGNEILEEFYTLIAPPEMRFDPFNIAIHGIHPEDVKDSPTFADIWPDVLAFIGDDIVMAHNAGFDLGVLKGTLFKYGIELPKLRYYCTWKLSKRLYPELPHRSLDALAERIHFPFKHHNALEDAKACAAIFHRMEEELAPATIDTVMKPCHFPPPMFPAL